MERQVILRDYQEAQASDFMLIQDYVRGTFDDLGKFAIDGAQSYSGLAVAASGTFEVQVAPGMYWSGGVMYPLDAVLTQSLVDYQPVANKVKIAVVAWGSEVETTNAYRDFVVNLETEQTEARLVSTEKERGANLGFMKGVESADPQLPTIPLDRLLIATITLGTSGIEDITMSTAGALSSLRNLSGRTAALEAWRSIAEPRISTIGSDLANLANSIVGTADTAAVIRVAADVARLKSLAGLPDTYASYGADRFLNLDETDTTNLEFLAKVSEGIRFSDEAANTSALQIFNPINAQVSQVGGMLLPAYNSVQRIVVDAYSGETSIAQYSQTSHTLTKQSVSRKRIRYGQSGTVCTNSAWWQSGTYNPATGILTRDGETWVVDDADRANAVINHRMVRVTQFWTDEWTETYWDYVDNTITIAGAQVAQSFLNTQAGWLTGVDLFFTKRGTSGNVNLAICQLSDSGTPNLSKVIYQATIDYLSIKAMDWTSIAIAPTYLEAGKRYAVVLTTNGNHYIGMATGAGSYVGGTFFYSTDGAYFAGDLTKDMMFGLRFAQFSASRVAVDLQPLSLSGGISDIDILAGMVVPDATKLTFQVQVNGAWVALSDVTKNALIGLPPLLPFQVVFQGTSDIHAGIVLSDSQVKVTRPRTAFKHFSTQRLLPAPTSTVRVITTLGGWNPDRHTFGVKLKIGATLVSPAVVQDIDLGDRRVERTSLFTLASPTASFEIVSTGSSTTALDLFLVEERVDVEL